MDYAMLVSGAGLLLTCSFGRVAGDLGSKFIFRLIPLAAALVLLFTALNNLNVI